MKHIVFGVTSNDKSFYPALLLCIFWEEYGEECDILTKEAYILIPLDEILRKALDKPVPSSMDSILFQPVSSIMKPLVSKRFQKIFLLNSLEILTTTL